MSAMLERSERRRAQILAASPPRVNGIDHVEVDLEDERVVRIHFLHPLPGQEGGVPEAPALTTDNLLITGGVRIRDIRAGSLHAEGRVLTAHLTTAGEAATYELRIVTSRLDPQQLRGFDPILSRIPLSFARDAADRFAPAEEAEAPPRLAEPAVDHLARDFSSFQRLMLDRLALTSPRWTERNAGDLGVAIVEALAYVADHLSYYQDAVATEAYLGTARRRVSIRRHARLLDYRMHEGCNARAWVALEVGEKADGAILPVRDPDTGARTRFLTRFGSAPVVSESTWLYDLPTPPPVVFEPMHDLLLARSHNLIRFYAWAEDVHVLPRGATRATLRDGDDASRLLLRAGDVLVLEEVVSPDNGREEDADPTRRHVVRLTRVSPEATLLPDGRRAPAEPRVDELTGERIVEIGWADEDALPEPFHVSALVDRRRVSDCTVARGNVVLVDHGRTADAVETSVGEDTLILPIEGRSITHAEPLPRELRPASRLVRQDPRGAIPTVRLAHGADVWEAQRDLTGSDRFAQHFVVEAESDGSAFIRFGDGTSGKRPLPGTRMRIGYRVGNGHAGNVGAESIGHILPARPLEGILAVRNPTAAAGGMDPESTEDVVLHAPAAFREQERAVTEEDCARLARRHPEVQGAVAYRRWTGSWSTMFVVVQRKANRSWDDGFKERLERYLSEFELAGSDMEIVPARYVHLDIAITVHVAPGYQARAVRQALLRAFSDKELPDGTRGFFHSSRFSFADPAYLSEIIAHAMSVPGVESVDAGDDGRNRFRRYGERPQGEADEGVLRGGPLEIIRVANDPDRPYLGRIEFLTEEAR